MRAVIYVRVSTTEQVANNSLETQERVCRDHCRKHGLEVERIFRDEGESAKTANRPALRAMLDFCVRESRRLDVTAVVVYKFDRLAREVADHTMITTALKDLGIRLHSATEYTENSPIGEFTEIVSAAMAQLDNRVKAERVTDGMKEGLSKGQWMWRPPLGYVKPGERALSSLEHDPERAHLIARGFEAIATRRLSRADALREITTLGLHTHDGKPLRTEAFSRILRNPVYAGRIVKEEWQIDVRGDFEPIVGVEVFDAVQDILAGKKPGRRHTLDNADFPLRRIVRCGRCATPLTGAWSKGRSKHYAYYRCAKSRCSKSIPVDKLEGLVLDELHDVAVSPEVATLFRAIVQDTWNDRTALSREREALLRKEDEKLRRRLNSLTNKYLDGEGIDAATFEEHKNRITAELDKTGEALAESILPDVDVAAVVDFAQMLLQDLPACWNRLQNLEKPQFLRALFPDGFTYEDGVVGTAEIPWWINENKHSAAAETDLVPLSTRSWNQVFDWLHNLEQHRPFLESALGIPQRTAIPAPQNDAESTPLREWNHPAP